MERRTLMLAAGLAAPALLARREAHGQAQAPAGAAAVPPAGPPSAGWAQAPGFFRFRLGGLGVTMLHDGSRPVPLANFVRNAPLEEVQRTLAESFLPTDQLRIPFTIACIETPRGLVLIDTGNGAQPAGAPVGRMMANMAAAGLDPARVTTVVISHFHGDHISGLTTAENAAAFPNAEVVVPAAEWAWWSDGGNEGRTPEGQRPTFANTQRRFAPYQGRVRQVTDGQEAVPGLRAVSAHGHTPGHTVWHLADGAEQMLILGDITNRPELNARRPDFHIVFDFDATAAEATRRRIFDRAAAERIRVAGYHFPFPATGFVAREGNGYRFVLGDWAAAT